ncbi:outer membrane protein assembly factor BamA [Consotaella salsifontis]|uniref:Outer membrane protein assembly factor BamA n=1 Tax=Consotaella salsifontis TaxID=1365950 RepID=A0A1T4SZN9_9HYPH|nr:outer membrane protein assembly factor BamA [Consotaella salsifontis]SKA33637.1 Beta-barrel assembly machine subunit BamA [Consotaella salsifontis]
MTAGSKLLQSLSVVALSTTILAVTSVGATISLTTPAAAAVVQRIDVRGNERVEADTIRSFSSIQTGQNINDAQIDAAVTRLFSTGLFSDVRISQSGGTLVIQVSENQIVNQVLFQGNSKIKDAQLEATVQTTPRGAFSEQTVNADVDAIRQAYAKIGRSDAVVTYRAVPVEGKRVNVVFDIQEGDRTKIETISFVGNKAFGDRRLKEVISLRESSLLSFISRDDVYDEDRLHADEEALRRFYYNHGYADFRIVSSVADLDESKNQYFVTFTVDEGERYAFGNVTIDSAIPGVDSKSLESELKTQPGDVYSAKRVEDTLVNLTNRVAEQGYAFAQVTPRGDRDFTNHTIAVDYVIDQGPRAYIERIDIRGNTKTRDYVVRREFDVSEGDAFNQVLVQRAKQRLENLGFFDTVSISTAPGTEPDKVIVIVDLKEKPTGELSVGGGYTTGSEGSGPVAEVGVTERNFLGRGQFIKVSAGFGVDTQTYNLSFTEPYFLGRRLAAGFDIYQTKNTKGSYDIERTGGDIRLAAPLTEDLTFQVAYNYKQEKFGDGNGVNYDENDVALGYVSSCGHPNGPNGQGTRGYKAPPFTDSEIINQAICDSPYITSSVSYSLVYNTLDSMKNPREGIYAQAGQEFAGLGGDAQYMKSTARASYFKTISEEGDIIGQLSGGAGNVTAIGGDLRVFDNFFKGQDIVRGFDSKGLGPRQRSFGDDYEAIGGTNYVNASIEATFPMPLVSRDFGLRGAVFADAGSLWGSEYDNEPGVVGTDFALRSSAGVGVIWASPFGPLRVNYAFPIMKEDHDETEEFSFGLSTKF